MNKWIVTPAFCKASLLEVNFQNIAKAHPDGFKRAIVDGHYPVDKEENRKRIQQLCADYGAVYLDPGCDLGLHGNLNFAVNVLSIGPEDFMVGVDPDDFPQPGSIPKLFEVMQADRSIAVLGLNFDVIRTRVQQGRLHTFQVAGHVVHYHPSVEMFKVAGWNMRFIHSLPNKFEEPNKYYGGIEAALHAHWGKQRLKLAYIHDHCEEIIVDKSDPALFDASYRKWKDAHLSGFKGSFEDYIKSGAV